MPRPTHGPVIMIQPDPKSYPLRGINNQLLTTSLFYEPWLEQADAAKAQDVKPVFSLHIDRDGLICARRTFVEERDPTGVKWANKYLEGPMHLSRLMGSKWFREAYDEWIAELDQVLISEAVDKIRQIASSSSPAAFQAAKFVAMQGWKGNKAKRGRPTKEEVAGELRRVAEALSVVDEDHARITAGRPNLKVVN